jgi:metal-dependent amidase/aminoacylase/carboxypeptidase family protein
LPNEWLPPSAAPPAPRTWQVVNAVLGAEDFSFFQQKPPAFFFWLGTRPKDKTAEEAASNHSPLFYIDKSGLELGVRAMAHWAVDYLKAPYSATPTLFSWST